MGLDMYLSKKTYVKNWSYMAPEDRHNISITGPAADDIQPARISHIVEELAYWRKANAIHQWFVLHCQQGRDECQASPVYHEHVRALVTCCQTLLTAYAADPVDAERLAMEVLPPVSGAFFGPTSIDDWYWDDLRQTVDMLAPELDQPYTGLVSYEYQASW